MSNLSPATHHLTATQWKIGRSGNPKGRKQGSKNLSTYIKDMLADDSFSYCMKNGSQINGAPIKAVIGTFILKALEGDSKAFDLLAKYGYGTKSSLDADIRLPEPILSGYSRAIALDKEKYGI